VKGFLKTAI